MINIKDFKANKELVFVALIAGLMLVSILMDFLNNYFGDV